MPQKDEVELDITNVAHGGVFVARHEGRVVFVPDTLPGERVRARIADRTHDRLGASDLAIVEFRKQMLEAVKAFDEGAPAIGTGAEAATPAVCSFQAIVPKTTDWRTYETRYVWLDGQDRPEFEPSYSVKS